MFIADVFAGDKWRNFVGCLRSVYINEVNILQRLHRHETAAASGRHDGSISGSADQLADDMRVVYADVGSRRPQPNFGCHSLALSAVRLTRPGAFIRLTHRSVSDAFNFRMSFASVKPDGLLVSTYTRVLTTTSVANDALTQPSTHGLVQVSFAPMSYFSSTRPDLTHQFMDPTRLDPEKIRRESK